MLGCIRMYNPSRDSFEWGSWLIVSGALPFVALESALSMYLPKDLVFVMLRLC